MCHIARYKAHNQKGACCERSWDNASCRDGSAVSLISNLTELWPLKFPLIRRISHTTTFFYFNFIRNAVPVWLLFSRYCTRLRLTFYVLLSWRWGTGGRFNFVSEFFLIYFIFQSRVVIPPPSNSVDCVGILLGTWVFVRICVVLRQSGFTLIFSWIQSICLGKLLK